MGKQIFINDSVGTVEFPDTMSDDEIAKTIQTDILGQSEPVGDTTKSASPTTVSAPTVAPAPQSPITDVLGKIPIARDIIAGNEAEKQAKQKEDYDKAQLQLAKDDLLKLQTDPKTSLALTSVRNAVNDYNTNPTEENKKRAFEAYSANKELVDYFDSTKKMVGEEPIGAFTQAPDDNKSDNRKQLESVYRQSQIAKETADAQNILQQSLSTGKSVKKIQEEQGGHILRGTKNFLAGAVGTLQGDVGFLGEVTGIKGLQDASNLLKQQVQDMSSDEMDIIDQVINGLGSTSSFVVPGLGTEALALRMPKLMKLANTLRIGVPTILEAAAEAKGVADQSRMEGKSEEDTKKSMWADFFANILLLAPTNAYGILSPNKAGEKFFAGRLKDLMAEGSQEGFQQIASDLSQGKKINWDDVRTQAMVGGVIGVIGGEGVQESDQQQAVGADRINKTLDLAKLTENLPPSDIVDKSGQIKQAEQRAQSVLGKKALTYDDILSELGYSEEQLKSYSEEEKKNITDSYIQNKPISNEKYKSVMEKNVVVPETFTERKQTPSQNRNEAIDLLRNTLPDEDARKVVVNLNNQQLEDFLNAKEEGYQAVQEIIGKLKSVEQRKTDMFAKEQEYKSMADEFGVKFNGLQFYGKDGKSVPLFTDNQTGSTFAVTEGETLPDAILRVRKRFEEAQKPEVKNDSQNIEGVPSPVPSGETPVQEKPVVRSGNEKVEASGNVQGNAQKVINLDKKGKGGRPSKYAQVDEISSPIIYSGVKIQPAWILKDGKVQIAEEYHGLEDFLDYSNKPSKETLASKSSKSIPGNADVIADEWYNERGMQGDEETFRQSLRKEIENFQKQGGYWSKKDIEDAVNRLNEHIDNGDQNAYEQEMEAMPAPVKKRVVAMMEEQWKEGLNESEQKIVASDPEIKTVENLTDAIESSGEASEIEAILREFDNERDAVAAGLSDEERANVEGQPSPNEYEPSVKAVESQSEGVVSKEQSAKSPEQINDVINEASEVESEIDQEISDIKKKKRSFDLAPEAKPTHPFIQELYDHIYSYEKAIENNFTRKRINDAIESYATNRLSGQQTQQKQIRQELMRALTGVNDVTRREAGLHDVIPLLQKYFEKVQPDQNIIDKLEEKKKEIAKQKARAIGHDQIFIDTFNALKDEAERKNLSNPQTAEPVIIGPEVGKKQVTMKYVPAEDKYTVTYKQIDNHVTRIKHYETLDEVLNDYRNEVNKYYDDPNKQRSLQDVKKKIEEAEANIDDIMGEISPEEQKRIDEAEKDRKKGGLNPDVLWQEGETEKPSYDNEIRYQKVKYYFNQIFRELGKDGAQFKERITTKYGDKLNNFVKRFLDENEIQERPTVQYVNSGKIPIPPEYVKASDYNNYPDAHQMYGINLMIHNFKQGNNAFLLADGTGFGKSAQLLAFADWMFKQTGKPALVVEQNKQIIENSIKREAASLGVGEAQYQSDLFNKSGQRKITMNKDHIEVVTYDDIKAKKYKVDQQYSVVIFDEAQNLKNANSDRAIMSDNIKADHHVYATATPMDNPHNAEYFLSKITGIPQNEIRRSMGYKVIFGEDQWGNPTRKIEYEEGKSYGSVQKALLRMRDSAIENGAMVRREYPFYGTVQPMYMALDQFQLEEQNAIDSGYGNHPKARMAAVGELSRWVEPLKVSRVFDSAMQDLKEGKQVIIVAEGISDTDIKKLGTTVRGFISAIGEKFTERGIPFAKIYGGGSLINDIDKFQSGEYRVAIMTPKSGGAGVNLDDAMGKAPRKMYVVTTNYAGDVFEQVLGRVSRRNTKSPADIRLVQFTNAITDRNRQNIIQRKLSTLHSIQSGIDPDKAVMDENEEKINGIIRTSGDNILEQEDFDKVRWIRGIGKQNKEKLDKFFSATKDVAANYTDAISNPKYERLNPKDYPQNPLVEWNKESLAEKIGYNGDPLAEQLNTEIKFDDLAKEYAIKNGNDAIIYQEGTFGEPELHLFGKDKNIFYQTGEQRIPIPMDEAVPKPTTKREQVVQAVYAQLPEAQAKAAMFVLDAGALTAVQNGQAKSISDYYENTLSKVTRMNYDPNMVFGDMLQQAFDKGLYAVHNTDATNLGVMLKNNGIPAPSIAVLTSPERFREFSDQVQLIFERKTVDPKASQENRLFGGDIFSPRAGEEEGASLQEIVDKVKKRFDEMPRGAEFGKESRRAVPMRAYATPEFKSIDEAKETSRKLIHPDTRIGGDKLAMQRITEENYVSAIQKSGVPIEEGMSREAGIRLIENQSFDTDEIKRVFEEVAPGKKYSESDLKDVQQALFELFNSLSPNFFEAKPLRVVGIEEVAGVIASPAVYDKVKSMAKGTILEGKIYKGGASFERMNAIRDLMKRNPEIQFQEDLSKQIEEQYIREQEAKGNLSIREHIKEQKYQKELGIRKEELAKQRQAKENQFNSLVRQEAQYKREIELARGKNDQEGVKKGLSALKTVQQQMNRLYKELGKATDDLFDSSPTLFQIPGERIKTVNGATDFSDFARTGKVALYLFENANFSTITHEFMHIWRRTGVFNEDQIKILNNWVGSNDWSTWTKQQEEKLARGWERYLYNGEAPNQLLRNIFQKMKKWMQEIYVIIQKGDPLDVNLTPEVKRVFDSIFDENATTNEKFKRVKMHDEVVKANRRELNKRYEDNIIIYRMYATPEMEPLLKEQKRLVDLLKNANPYEANDIEEQLVPLNAKIDEMSENLKTLKRLAKQYHRVDKLGFFLDPLRSRFSVMTRKLGKAGGELIQRGFAGDLVHSTLRDIAHPYLNAIAEIYSKYDAKPNENWSFLEKMKDRVALWRDGSPFTTAQQNISKAVIQAIEDERNAKWVINNEVPKSIVVKNDDGTVNAEMTQDAKEIFKQTKGLLNEFREIETSLGYKTRDAYFTHIKNMDVMDQQMFRDLQRALIMDEKGVEKVVSLTKDVTNESNYLKPRTDAMLDIDSNLPRVLSMYIGSVTRKLSYDSFVEYIKKDFKNDLSPMLKRDYNTETLLDIARDYASNVLHPASGSGKLYNILKYLRKNQYSAYLSYNVKATMDNRLQVFLARLFVSKEAEKIENKLFDIVKRSHFGISGNLQMAMQYARNAMQNYLEITTGERDTSGGKFREFFEKHDIFKSAEVMNWQRAELLGIIDSAIHNKNYPALLELYRGDQMKAINQVLEDDSAFQRAVSNATYVSTESQVGITPSVRPSAYDSPILRMTLLMLRSFKNRQLELMARSFKVLMNEENGMKENSLKAIFARGISPDAEPAEALLYFADYNKALGKLIAQMGRENRGELEGLNLKFINDYYAHSQQQEKELAQIIQQIQPSNDRARVTSVWARYYALLTVNSFSSKLFWYFVSPFLFGWAFPDDKDKEKKSIEDAFNRAYTRVLWDLSPIPAYGGNPKNLTVTPILPDFGSLESAVRYGRFSGRELSKDIVNYSMNSFVPYLGAVNRALDYRLSSNVVDFIAPKKNGASSPQDKLKQRIERQRKALENRLKK